MVTVPRTHDSFWHSFVELRSQRYVRTSHGFTEEEQVRWSLDRGLPYASLFIFPFYQQEKRWTPLRYSLASLSHHIEYHLNSHIWLVLVKKPNRFGGRHGTIVYPSDEQTKMLLWT